MNRIKLPRQTVIYLSVLILLSVVIWLPRLRGPLDLRYDAGVYYILGTSLAEGKGYRLLNEPGEIQAIQYPPLLPLFVEAREFLPRHVTLAADFQDKLLSAMRFQFGGHLEKPAK